MNENLTSWKLSSGDLESIESAKLKLVLLKENFKYQEFFKNLLKDVYLNCPQLEKPDEKNMTYFVRLLTLLKGRTPFESNYDRNFEDVCWFISSIPHKEYPLSDILALLNPECDLKQIPNDLVSLLPRLFDKSSILELPRTDRLVMYGLKENGHRSLNPYEKILFIDLRKKKAQLKKEFEDFIDRELDHQRTALQIKRGCSETWKEIKRFGFDLWEPDTRRNREEVQRHLTVWELRKKKKSFPEIAAQLKLTQDNAKKSFYRAYELTQGKDYDRETFDTAIVRLHSSEVQKTCDTCPDRNACTIPCPQVSAYVDRDYVGSKEVWLKKDTDAYRDALYQGSDGVKRNLPKKPTS